MTSILKEINIPYGESNFEMIRQDNYLYVDKTHFIRQIERTKRVLYLRPRRFGKSLFISTLECYYDIHRADKFDELFKGLYIHEHPTASRNHYYVLRFNFSGIQTTNIETINRGFLTAVQSALKVFVRKYGFDISLTKNAMEPATILREVLGELEASELQHKVCILIDEYDHFTNAVLSEGLDGFMTLITRGGMVRSFYEVIKIKYEQGVVGRFFMTGVMSVSLDNMTSGFNIATNITTEPAHADMMGFSENEVKRLLVQCELTKDEQTEIYDIFKQNYNGYLFSEESDTKVFNSTLIMYYLSHYIVKKRPPKSLIDPNLNQSGTTIQTIVDLKNREANYAAVEEIVLNKQISGELSTFIDVDKKYDEYDFITLMFNIGLLTIKKSGFQTVFEIPNKITEVIYLKYLAEMVPKKNDYTIGISAQKKALSEMGEHGKIKTLTRLVSDFLAHLSVRNTINFDEKYIKLIYMMLLSATEQYFVYDEFPARQGYTDLIILKTPNSYAKHEYLIELKYIKKSEMKKNAIPEARIEKAFLEGVQQINDYMQDKRMVNRPNLKKFVIVFLGFEVVKLGEV